MFDNPFMKDLCTSCGTFRNDFGECECDEKALLFAEKYGIIDYQVIDRKMVYENYYRNEGRFVYVVDLENMEEKVFQIQKAEWEKSKMNYKDLSSDDLKQLLETMVSMSASNDNAKKIATAIKRELNRRAK